MIAFAVVAAACAKEKDLPASVEKVNPDGTKTIVFTAQAPTKTTIDANDQVVSWSAGDEVKFVWDGGSATATASEEGSSTNFSVTVPDGVTEIYAVYPANAGGSYDNGNVKVHFNGSRTDGSFAANDISVAKATKSGDTWSNTLAFKNVACLIKVGVTSSTITKLQVYAGNGETLAGYLPVNIASNGDPSLGAVSSSPSDHVTMEVSGPGNYYIPVIPGVTMSKGFQVKLFEGDDQITPFFYNGEYTTARGKVIKLSDIESHAGQYYVTPSGAGTMSGQSWTNAMDAATFKAFIENADNYFVLRGATIHLSAEEFTLGDYLQPDFSGHSETAFTIEGTTSGSDITTFVGGTGDPAGTLWPKASCNLTVKNVKFTGTDGNSNRAAIRVNTSSAKLTLENCVFDGNKTSGNGGAIAVFKAAQLDIKDCEFYGNNANGGACLYIKPSIDMTVNVIGGIFKGNYAVGTSDADSAGAVFYATNDGGTPTLKFSGVTFKENYNYVGTNANIGGILRLQASNSKAYFDNCLFDGNYTNRDLKTENKPCAAIVTCRIGDVSYYFNACEFKENTSGTGNSAGVYGGTRGTVFATLAGSTFAFNNCSFHDNYGGRNTDDITWIGMDNTSSTLILANTTIAGDNYRAPGAGGARKNNWGVIKFQNTGNYYLLNTILCSLDPVGNSFWVNGDIMVDGTTTISNGGSKLPVYCWYSKISKEGDNRTNWTVDTGSGHDYYATSASFGSWSSPYTWNGTLTGTNSNMLAATADVNSEIQSADADFYTWLSSIGALGKDINGRDRGDTSWPGCYQN